MDVWDAWDIYIGILALLAVGMFFMYRVKLGRARKVLEQAREALAEGEDDRAVLLLKEALEAANEEPRMEIEIIGHLREIYSRHGIDHDFADYLTLVDQYRALSKKSSTGVMSQIVETQNLKLKLVHRMPSLSSHAPTHQHEEESPCSFPA